MIVADKPTPYPSGRQRHRFTVDAVYRMPETGIIRADQRLELIEGELIRHSVTSSVMYCDGKYASRLAFCCYAAGIRTYAKRDDVALPLC